MRGQNYQQRAGEKRTGEGKDEERAKNGKIDRV